MKINYLGLKKLFKHILVGISFLTLLIHGKSGLAQVTITEADLGNICVDGGFYTLPDIIISESNTGDFNTTGGISNYRIELPPNFEFNTADTMSGCSSLANSFASFRVIGRSDSALGTINLPGASPIMFT